MRDGIEFLLLAAFVAAVLLWLHASERATRGRHVALWAGSLMVVLGLIVWAGEVVAS